MESSKESLVSIHDPDDKEVRRYATGRYVEIIGGMIFVTLFLLGMIPISVSLGKVFDTTQVLTVAFAVIGLLGINAILVKYVMKGLEAERQERLQAAMDEGRIVRLPSGLMLILQDEVRAASCDDKCLFELTCFAAKVAQQIPIDAEGWNDGALAKFSDAMTDYHDGMNCPSMH